MDTSDLVRNFVVCLLFLGPGRRAQSVGHLTRKSEVLGSIPGLATYFRFSFRFSRRAVVSIGTRRKICIFIHIIKCQSINYNAVKFQDDRLRNKKVTI